MYNHFCIRRNAHTTSDVKEVKKCSVCDHRGNCKSESKIVICPTSKEKLKLLGEETHHSPSSWSNKPREERNKILMDRSQKHFEKDIKPQYQELNPKKKKK